jgi:hypothetical protein
MDRLARQRPLCRRSPVRPLGPPHHRQRLERRSANQRRPPADSLRPLRPHPPPIYTGILLATLGTALVIGEYRGLLATVMFLVGFSRKARKEESFLAAEFGAAFDEHRGHTGFFLPRIS